jgi:hypothetical protein
MTETRTAPRFAGPVLGTGGHSLVSRFASPRASTQAPLGSLRKIDNVSPERRTVCPWGGVTVMVRWVRQKAQSPKTLISSMLFVPSKRAPLIRRVGLCVQRTDLRLAVLEGLSPACSGYFSHPPP